ncbi:MAG TPA: ABC transporter substrate-binding protein [Candidatus Saccharimonadales bacterium]|jgi:peptide/nickel transport system substrate-binding protein
MEDIGLQAETNLERNFFRRFGHLWEVRRFAGSWLMLVLLLLGCVIVQTRALSGYYQKLQPVPGGIYTEGIIGSYTDANPIYATGEVDQAVSRLIFAGLLKYNNQNQLVGDLADSWQAQDNGLRYVVHLRPHLTWQDGQPLTANDVVFTYHVIQNPDAQSPLQASWQGVTVTATDSQTVVFTLPNPLASFPYSLTTGIIPQHLLASVPMDQMRSVAFDTTNPVGAGPFSLKSLEVTGDTPQTHEEQLQLQPFAGYYAGKPKLASFVVHAFASNQRMLSNFGNHELTAMVGLDELPKNLADNSSVQTYQMPLTAGTYVFFKTSQGVLADTKVRQALVLGADTPKLVGKLGYPAMPVDEPLLRGQLGYNSTYAQSGYNSAVAAAVLSADGWIPGANGIRYKHGQPLTFNLFAQNTAEYTMVTNTLAQEWRSLGVDMQVHLQTAANLQPTLESHGYDALLYGISIGVDPDVFAYWDSSQADIRAASRLNFSEWSNPTVDAALDAGRTRTDPAERVVKYQPFLQAWQQDAPALGLYQPRFLYVTRGRVFGLTEHQINTDTDRYNNVQNWEIRESPRTDKP